MMKAASVRMVDVSGKDMLDAAGRCLVSCLVVAGDDGGA